MELGGKTLYHGTVHEFTEIDLSKCDNALKDFGTGFYLTSEFFDRHVHGPRLKRAQAI